MRDTASLTCSPDDPTDTCSGLVNTDPRPSPQPQAPSPGPSPGPSPSPHRVSSWLHAEWSRGGLRIVTCVEALDECVDFEQGLFMGGADERDFAWPVHRGHAQHGVFVVPPQGVAVGEWAAADAEWHPAPLLSAIQACNPATPCGPGLQPRAIQAATIGCTPACSRRTRPSRVCCPAC